MVQVRKLLPPTSSSLKNHFSKIQWNQVFQQQFSMICFDLHFDESSLQHFCIFHCQYCVHDLLSLSRVIVQSSEKDAGN